jgi:UrcA family protein
MTTATSKLFTLGRTLAFLGACATFGAVPATFAAVPSSDVPSVTVRYSDLDLTTTVGVNTLYRRIANAAYNVCPRPDMRDLQATGVADQCRAEAVARAVHDVNNPKLAMVHANRVSRG